MHIFDRLLRSISRQLAILTGVIGLTFAAGIDWAQAAEIGASHAGAMPSEPHVMALFLLTVGILAASLRGARIPVPVRGRPAGRRAPRR